MDEEIKKKASELIARIIEKEDPEFATIVLATSSDTYILKYKKEG